MRDGSTIAVLRIDDQGAFQRFVAMKADGDQGLKQFFAEWHIARTDYDSTDALASVSARETPPEHKREVRKVPPSAAAPQYRFEVAISFAGDDKRDEVRAVAELLREKIGDGKVFFDEWFESELAGHDAQVVLQDYYGKKTRLVVTCVCQRYNEKPWTQEEWRAIQAFERNLRDAGTGNVKRMRLLPLRFGDGEIDGLFSTAIVPDVRERSTEDIAKLILDRLDLAKRGAESTLDDSGEKASGDHSSVWAIDEIERILAQVTQKEFVASLSKIVAEIQTSADGDLSDHHTLAEKLVKECRIDELIPKLVQLPDRFPGESHHLSDITRHLLPCNYYPEVVATLRQQWAADQLCFFSVPTMTVAESIAAGFDGKPAEMVFSSLESRGVASLFLGDHPPTEGPDAVFADAINILKDMIFDRSLAELESGGSRLNSDTTEQIAVNAKALSSQLATRRLRNNERTTYALVNMPANPDEAHLRRMVLGLVFAEVNRDRKEAVLVFGEIVTAKGAKGITDRDLEAHIRFLLDFPNLSTNREIK